MHQHEPVTPDPARIVVPRQHGQFLIEPSLEKLADFLRGAGAFWKEHPGVDPAMRAKARQVFWDAARQSASAKGAALPRGGEAMPWIVTGHQLEFYHAGVWAKVLAADELARRMKPFGGAVAFDVLVDHDVIEHFGFDLPRRDARGEWTRIGVNMPEEAVRARPGNPVEFASSPDRKDFDEWMATIHSFDASRVDSLDTFLDFAARSLDVGENKNANMPGGYTRWLSSSRRAFEAAMGIEVHHVPATHVCRGEAWDWFVRQWIDHAAEWTAIYNRHLAAYRARQGIKSPQHPMPDLARDLNANTWELPFWIYRQDEARQRLVIRKQADGAAALLGADAVPLQRGVAPGFFIRPRALSLTMFVRLFIADVFIHGIGGALYDQITDGMLRDIFHAVPAYACVSAAWLLPLNDADQPAADLGQLKWRRHHLHHNPQLAFDGQTHPHAPLLEQRRRLIAQLATSIAEHRRTEKSQRRAWFKQLHGINDQLRSAAPSVFRSLDHQIAAAEDSIRQNKVAHWREWFFALHPRASLQQLITQIRR